MARARIAKHPAPPPVEEESQEEPEETTSADGQPVKKADAVRAAVAAGMDNPSDGVAWIKSHFGIELAKPMWSSYVAQQKARERKAEGGESSGRGRPRASTAQPAGVPQGFGSDVKELRALMEKTGGGDELRELIGQLSGLLGKYGASGLNELIEAIE